MHRLGYRLGCLAFDLGCLCLDFKSVIWEDYGNGVLSKFKDSPVVGVDDFRDAPASSLADVQLQEDGRRLRKAVLHEDTASCQILNHAHVAKGSLHLPSNSMEIIAVPQNGILFRCFRRGVVRFFLFPESVKID